MIKTKILNILKSLNNEYDALFFGSISHLVMLYCFFNTVGSIYKPNPFFWLLYISLILEVLVIASLFFKEDKKKQVKFTKDFFILLTTIIFWFISAFFINIYLTSVLALFFFLLLSRTKIKDSMITSTILIIMLFGIKLLNV